MEEKRRDDIFNPTYREEKKFFRKDNKRRIAFYIMILVLIVYGSREFIFSNIIEIEIRTVTDRKINSISFTNGRCDIFIMNKSPFKIRLIIDDNIETNYNGGILFPKTKYYFWFESNTTKTLNIDGVKG